MNCKKLEEFNDIGYKDILKKYNFRNKKKFLYIGAFSPGRNLLELIEIFKDQKDSVFILGGNGHLEKQIKEKLHKNIIFLGRVKKEDVPKYTLASDYLLAIYKSKLLNNDVAGPPNKLFEAIAAGKPIITSKNGSTGDMISKIGCGITINPDSKEEIELTINKLISNKKLQLELSNKAKESQEKYNWDNESKNLVNSYQKL
jgi:glycosyltransferase involved in cell wall biosynthesis